MRMRGEIVGYKREMEDEEEEDYNTEEMNHREKEMVGGGVPQSKKFVVVVGYALTSKKVMSFLQPKLEGLARSKGILFVAIDQNKPLSDQGPFDIVLHKLSGSKWRRNLEVGSFESFLCVYYYLQNPVDNFQEWSLGLTQPQKLAQEEYRLTHPDVTVLDPPDAIQQVYNRQYMLEDVADLNLSDTYGKVGVPRQLVIEKDSSSIPDAVGKAGLRLPIVAKPLAAKSHELSLAYDKFSLQMLEPPLVLQEFINHGGILFKVYIVGETVKVVRRFSLPDVSKRELSKNPGVFRFPRVSCAAASADEADLDPCVGELPPRPLLERLAKELRRRSGLRLFNLDIIRELGTEDRYYVIDINYFPGYGKMPEYEHIFTDFLLSLVKQK
ncbi:Inositol-tetrakisphosphate 1-kinase 2 [Capsicum chinense]|nr:Inositol-tetrakisphosphate 1-kinase 2 [Capsicum chinense]